MKLGIVGLPLSGRSTLFEALTRTAAGAESKMENRLASVRVPDSRIDTLSGIYSPKKTTYAQIEYFLPGAALTKEEKAGEQSQWTKVRSSDALLHVVRNFEGPAGRPDPVSDFKKTDDELVFSDLVVVETRIARLEADLKRNRKIDPNEFALLGECRAMLDGGTPLRRRSEIAGAQALRGFTFLSAKPMLVILNNPDHDDELPGDWPAGAGDRAVTIRGRIEREIAQMSEEDAADFLSEFRIVESAMLRVIRESYTLLGLISFFTVGPDEVRAWTIRRDLRAVDAAEAIHSDIRKGFIRAEVVAYDDLIGSGSYQEARRRGLVRLEGKEYIMKDGDIVDFRFNV
ncbi:redox-regulated ATPase YchF [bacterium]|nr:redox-regulated ATPase YchF [bacterium]